ncbi:MAG TPA: thioredoxin family protein [Salinimicrobium sp.]|nr:thioredoxin family protein [Salinimicrobium sp.]
MNYAAYKNLFEAILNSENPPSPYDQAEYIVYTKMNFSRMKRWEKTMKLDEELVNKLKNLDQKQHWIIIVEPWCGDAAHILPFLVNLAETSENITYDLQLRDSEPFLINSYLTNGGKSIPKLIARDENGNDIFTWGPRPEKAQVLMQMLKEADAEFEKIKLELQTWYNKDKGKSLFLELLEFYK